MVKSNRILLIGIVLLGVIAASSAYTAEENTEKRPGPDFKDKVVMLLVDYSSALEDKRDTEYLVDPLIQEMGGRFFITGKAYSVKNPPKDSPRDWRKGSQIGIAWDKVHQFYIFTPDQMEEIVKRRSEEQDE